jgi:hypothetical protein
MPAFAGMTLLFGAAPTFAADKPCATPEHRQFDFLAGEWIVRNPAGKEAGRNSISKSEDGCVLHERWTSSTSKYRGQSLNIYDAPRKVWHQSWVDNSGLLLVIEGGWRNGAMVLEGDRPAKDGRSERHRITWTPQPDGGLRQLWETSPGPGPGQNQDWKVLFDGRYSRK